MNKLKEVNIVLPNGFSASAVFPFELDEKLVELAFRAVLGGVVAVSQAYSDEVAREYLIRFVASIINESASAAKSTQMNNKISHSNSSRIIDDFLKSIHKDNKDVSQEGNN